MSDPGQKSQAGGLRLRVYASAVMIPVMLGIIYAGRPFFDVLMIAMAGVLMWEWHGLLAPRDHLTKAVGIVATSVFVGVAAYAPVWGWGLLAVAGVVAGRRLMQSSPMADATLLGIGPIYIGAACLALILTYHQLGSGFGFWLFLSVWATDIGAYAFGRLIGGPKLAPRMSPNKTWAGLIGGMVCAALVSTVAVRVLPWMDEPSLALTLGLGAAVAVVAQMGDLFESAIKRRVGAKDSSRLIPGHGGVFDRVDGLLSAGLLMWWMTA